MVATTKVLAVMVAIYALCAYAVIAVHSERTRVAIAICHDIPDTLVVARCVASVHTH